MQTQTFNVKLWRWVLVLLIICSMPLFATDSWVNLLADKKEAVTQLAALANGDAYWRERAQSANETLVTYELGLMSSQLETQDKGWLSNAVKRDEVVGTLKAIRHIRLSAKNGINLAEKEQAEHAEYFRSPQVKIIGQLLAAYSEVYEYTILIAIRDQNYTDIMPLAEDYAFLSGFVMHGNRRLAKFFSHLLLYPSMPENCRKQIRELRRNEEDQVFRALDAQAMRGK